MRKTYNQPEVQVTEIHSMVVMQAASAPAVVNMGINTDASTDAQW